MNMDYQLDIIENDEYVTAKLTGVRRPSSLLEAAARPPRTASRTGSTTSSSISVE